MPLPNYVQRRPGGYYYRQRVPKMQQKRIGRHEIVVSLHTSCPKATSFRAAQVYVAVNNALNTSGTMTQNQLTHQFAAQIAERWKRRALNADFDQRVAGQASHVLAEDISGVLHTALHDLRQVRLDRHAEMIDSVVGDHRLGLEPDSEDWRRLGYYLLKANTELLQEIQKRSDPTSLEPMAYIPPDEAEQAHPGVVPGAHPGTLPGAGVGGWLRLSEAVERWEQEGDRRALTVTEWRYRINRFVELKGDLYVHEITADDVRDFKDAYKQIPAKLPRADRQRTLPQIIERYAESDVDRLKPNSVNNALTALSSVLTWCVENRWLKENVARGIRVPRPKRGVQRRLPFNAADLEVIFEQSPVYRLGQRPRGGGGHAAYWIPVLALYTGARLEELGQLAVDDVRQEAGRFYLDINDQGENKYLKTPGSKRRIPIHKDVLGLGFLDYMASVRQHGQEDLFPHVRSATEKRTSAFSKWVNGYLRKQCGISDPRKVFHSFRHTFKDACREAGIPQDVHNALTGHTTGSVHEGYGLGFSVRVLDEAVQSIHWGDLKIGRVGVRR